MVANKAHHSTKHKFIRQKLRGAAQTMNYIMSTPLKTKKSAPAPRQRLRPVAATFLRQELQHIEHPEHEGGPQCDYRNWRAVGGTDMRQRLQSLYGATINRKKLRAATP